MYNTSSFYIKGFKRYWNVIASVIQSLTNHIRQTAISSYDSIYDFWRKNIKSSFGLGHAEIIIT